MSTKQKIKFIIIVVIIALFIAGILFARVGAVQTLLRVDFFNLLPLLPQPVIEFEAYSNVNLEEAWNLANSENRDLKKIEIGIVDTGFNAAHPEFRSVDFATTPPLSFTDLGILDKKTGEILSHGTNVAGIVGANNTSFPDAERYQFPHMNGVLSGVHTLPYRMEVRSYGKGLFDEFSALKEVFELSQLRVDVINMSFGNFVFFPQIALVTPFYDLTFRSHPETVFVIAAGNENTSTGLITPANLGLLNNVITVGGNNLDNTRLSNSNFGLQVSLSAPADLVWSPTFFQKPLELNDYEFFSGTSAAAPFVTGVAGILKALEPEYQNTSSTLVMNPATIKDILIASADPISPDKSLGSGCFGFNPLVHNGCRLNAHRAVAWYLPPGAVELNEPSGVTTDSIELSWATSTDFNLQTPDFKEFKIFRSASQRVDESDALIATITDINQTTFVDSGLAPGTAFFYKVFTVDGVGLTSGSNEVSATTLAGAPPTPVSLNIFPEFTEFATAVRWTRNPDFDFASYDILRNNQSIFTTQNQDTVWFKDVPPALPLSYQVEVKNQANLTSLSNIVTGRKFAPDEVIERTPGVPEPGDIVAPDIAVPSFVLTPLRSDCPRDPLFRCIGPFETLSRSLNSFGQVNKLRQFPAFLISNSEINGQSNFKINVHFLDILFITFTAQDDDYQVFIPIFNIRFNVPQGETRRSSFRALVTAGSFDIVVQTDTQARVGGTLNIVP